MLNTNPYLLSAECMDLNYEASTYLFLMFIMIHYGCFLLADVEQCSLLLYPWYLLVSDL